MDIKDKLVLITGASSGIGEATAKAVAKRGGRVVLLARNRERLKEVAAEIVAQGGWGACYPIDLSSAEAIRQVSKKIINETGTPDIIVNNAGAGRWLTVEETSAEEVELMTAVPYFAAFNITREFLPGMLDKGSGHVVNITSVASRIVWPGNAAYTASRWAMNGFSNALRTELRGSGICVTLAVFGKVNSTFWTHNPGNEERLPWLNRFIPDLTTEQAAEAIVRGIERNAREVIRPGLFRLVFLLNFIFPRTTEMMMRLGWESKKG